MNRYLIYLLPFFLINCNHDPAIDTADYPPEIGNIIITKCAIKGCHNTISAGDAEGVDLSSWEKMMNGRDLGATVIPYSHSQSLLYLYVNTYSDLGVGLSPTMPKDDIPLSREEVLKIRFWINAGAPNKDGFVKWSDNPQRQKYYIANRGCDLIASIDPASSLVMRYIKVGHVFEIEKPACVKVSQDNKSVYVSFANSDILQRFNTNDDTKTGELNIGAGNWSSMLISTDSKTAYLVNTDSIHSELAIVNLESMTLIHKYSNSLLSMAINLEYDKPSNKLYIGSALGNFIYSVNISDPKNAVFTLIPLIAGVTPDINANDKPSSIYIDLQGNRLYVACCGTGILNQYRLDNIQLLNTVFTGYTAQNIAYDKGRGFLYIACSNDTTTLAGKYGFIALVDDINFKVVDRIYTDIQPHGLAIDESRQRLIVANRNAADSGPPPHHRVECEGRIGSYSYIDLSTLKLVNEEGFYLSVDPYSVALKK